MATLTGTQPARSRAALLRAIAVEFLFVGGLIGAYEGARGFVGHQVSAAFEHAEALWSLERFLHLPSDAVLQQPLLHHSHLAVAANVYYVVLHWPVTLIVLLWLLWRRPPVYTWMRRTFIVMTATGLALYAFLPTAPPRLLPGAGLVDTMHDFGPSLYSGKPGSGLEDQFAAMPSLHVGWAALVAVAIILSFKTRWRWLALLYPVLTWFDVMATANHYFLDGFAAILLLAVSMWLTKPRVARVGVPTQRQSEDDAEHGARDPVPGLR